MAKILGSVKLVDLFSIEVAKRLSISYTTSGQVCSTTESVVVGLERRSQLNLKDLCFLLWTESGCLLFLMFDLCIVLRLSLTA